MKSKKFNVREERNQSKITQFFKKNSDSSTSSSGASTPAHSSLRNRPPNILNFRPIVIGTPSPPKVKPAAALTPLGSDDDDIIEVVEVEKPPPSPKELIVISSDSDSEPEQETNVENVLAIKPEILSQDEAESSSPNSPSLMNDSTNPKSHYFTEGSSSDDEILSQIDIDEAIRSSQEEKENRDKSNSTSTSPEKCGTFEDNDNDNSSGDEILSQIDVDEVIRSQSLLSVSDTTSPSKQDILLTPSKDNQTVPTSSNLATNASTSSSALKSKSPSLAKLTSLISSLNPPTPKKSAKSPVTKFSPIKHIRLKRTSSQASLDSPKKLQQESQNHVQNQPDRSPKKKLNFDTASGSKIMGGGRYYLRNFMTILTEVISDTFHAHLINDGDHTTVQRFISLSLNAQSLYVRLFQRKLGWKPVAKLNRNYKELPDDLLDLCRELTKMGFFEEISSLNASLEEILDVLDLPKFQSFAKKMMVTSTKKTKEALKEAVLAKVKSQRTINGSCGSNPAVKQALLELGPAFRVSHETKTLFSRLFILYSPPQYWEIENDQASNQLLIILLNQKGVMEYPNYKIRKETLMYRTREDLIKFHESFAMHSNLVAWIESKDWERVIELANEAERLLSEHLENLEAVEFDKQLPRFLRIHTAGSVLCHICWMGVDGFQKLKRFKEANKLLRTILDQTVYLPNYRGRCWERLAINEGHLKKSKEDIRKLLEDGLLDPHLQMNHKLILSQRWEKTNPVQKTNSKKTTVTAEKPPSRTKTKKTENAIENQRPSTSTRRTRSQARKIYIDDSEDEEEAKTELPEEVFFNMDTQLVTEVEANQGQLNILTLKHVVPTRTITGEKMDRGPGNMGKAYFIGRQDASGTNRISSVEQHAIDFYLHSEGFTSGLHGEGSTVCTLYGLLFWNIIFNGNFPDAFHTRYQSFPLDFHFEDFYLRRESLIQEKLYLIREILSIDEIFSEMEQTWSENENKLSIVSWTLFESPQILKGLMKAMGQKMIADICERLSRNYRYFSSGFPDLVVWDEQADKVLFVEVKGPGDSLSPKQQLWLEWMIEKEIPCEVCHVRSVSNKRIRLEDK